MVFSEELIAKKLVHTERTINDDLGTIDFVGSSNKQVVFRTNQWERPRVVLQIGAADSGEALAAALIYANDVAGVDLNMGCPQHFSLSGGMGAALLRKPEVATDIVRTLRGNLPPSVRVSCKIRLLNSAQETMELMRQLESAGAEMITVHARRVTERPRDPARWSELKELVQCVKVPVVVNGDVFSLEDARKLALESGANTVMCARGCLADCRSVFRGDPYASFRLAVRDYMAVGTLCGSTVSQDKWLIAQIARYRKLGANEDRVGEINTKLQGCRTREAICEAFELEGVEVDSGKTENSLEAWRQAVSEALVRSKTNTMTRKRTCIIEGE
jgi:tRNA-dihydrouridine synthase 2